MASVVNHLGVKPRGTRLAPPGDEWIIERVTVGGATTTAVAAALATGAMYDAALVAPTVLFACAAGPPVVVRVRRCETDTLVAIPGGTENTTAISTRRWPPTSDCLRSCWTPLSTAATGRPSRTAVTVRISRCRWPANSSARSLTHPFTPRHR